MLLHVSMLVSFALVVVAYDTADADLPDCKTIPQSREDPMSSLVCPERAVCGDEWRTIRDWYNGTRCWDSRVNLRCTCPGDQECPIGNEGHRFYSNTKHSRYLCENKCDIDLCTTHLIASVEMVQNSPELGFENFYKINCRCPGHDKPIQAVPGKLLRSTTYKGRFMDFLSGNNGIRKVLYRCNPDVPITKEDICS